MGYRTIHVVPTFLASLSASETTLIKGTEHDSTVDGYGWRTIVSRSYKDSVNFNWNLGDRVDVLYNDRLSLQNCKDNPILPDACSSKTVYR